RLLARELRAALPAAADGPRLRLPGGQRGGAAAHANLRAPLAAPLRRAPQAAPGVRARHLRAAAPREPADLRARAAVRGGHRPLRAQPRALRAGGRARSRRVRAVRARGDAGTLALPADRHAALPAHARPARVVLVPAAK